MKRFVALFLICVLLLPGLGTAEALDYTVAEKLVKQLAAGSGFSGVVTLEADTELFATLKPIVLDVDYIFVRPEEVSLGEHRVDAALMDGETVLTQAHARLLNGDAAFQADVVSPDWYALSGTSEAEEPMQHSAIVPTAAAILTALQTTKGMDKEVDAALKATLESFITRIDIWIEGYRQSAELDKLEDGTTTMAVDYVIPASAVKSQLKQLLYELFSDRDTLAFLQLALGDDLGLYLNPLLKDWYFDCIDALPLESALTISRVFSMKGETLSLQLSLPMYSSDYGAMTVSYERTSGAKDDLPDENVVTLQSAVQNVSLTWQEYSSMTGVDVMQGSLKAEGENELDAAFTLRQEVLESRDADDREVYEYNASLTLSPADGSFDETEMVLSSRFASEERKSAATEISATLTVSSANEAVEMTLEGVSRKKWEPEEIPLPVENPDWKALLPGAGVRTLAVLADYITLPESQTADTAE